MQESEIEELRRSARVLRLSGMVTEATVKAAYHRAMQRWHPDLHHAKNTLKLAEWHARTINKARDFLLTLPPGTMVPDEPKPSRPAGSRRRAPSGRSAGDHTVSFSDPQAEVTLVSSSMFSAVGYAEKKRVLYLKFNSGSVYRYHDVPRATYSKFLRARSKSAFAKRHIFHGFKYDRCSRS